MQAKPLLDYIYYGEVVVRKKELEGFIKLAKDLQVKGLMDYKDSLTTREEDSLKKMGVMKKEIQNKYNRYSKENMLAAIEEVKKGEKSDPGLLDGNF